MEKDNRSVLINLLAIARYDNMPDYPIQFMTVGKLSYANSGEALLQYVESQQDEETGEILKNYLARTDRNLPALHRYADMLGCGKILRTYMEVLL